MSAATYRVCFVCTGNICRSPMGEVVLREMLQQAGLSQAVEVDSAGTSSWHVGDGADPRTISTLRGSGYDGTRHTARQFEAGWFAERDLVLAADRSHLRSLRSLGGTRTDNGTAQVRLVREFDPNAVANGDIELSDPYYGGSKDFTRCLAEVEAACRGLVDFLREQVAGGSPHR